MTFTTGSGLTVAVQRKLGAGGQGEVYAVIAPPGQVFKKYLRTALDTDPGLARRLHVMVTYPPAQWRETQSGHVMLTWPSELVTENTQFAGYLMPMVDMDNTVSLHRITNPTDRRSATGTTSWMQGFTWRYLVRTGANLAQATHVLHHAGTVIGDFNESNVRVTREARVTLLDCDSMQITDPSTGQRFFCSVGRPEFTAPELLHANWKTTVRQPNSDLFALAVHLYQLLLEGEHPFRGVWTGSGDKPSVPDLARQGIWTHNPNGQLQPRPSAIGISLLPDAIAAMFRLAFQDGAVNPADRPSALEWQQALSGLDARLRECGRIPEHIYPGHLGACPWCRHAAAAAPVLQQPLPPANAPTGITPLVAVPQRTVPPRTAPRVGGTSPIVTRPPVKSGPSGPPRVRRRTGRNAAFLISSLCVLGIALAFVVPYLGSSGSQPGLSQSSVPGQDPGQSAASASAGQPHTNLASAASWKGVPVSLPTGATPAGQIAELQAIACPTAATCVATGYYLDSHGVLQGVIETRSAGRWIATEAPSAASHKYVTLPGVACADAGVCTAVGSTQGSQRSDALIETLSHGTWTPSVAPLPADAASGANQAGLENITCPAVGACVAVGSYTGPDNDLQGLIETLSNGTWTPVEPPLPEGAALTQDVSINGVACTAVGSCVAVGSYVDQNSVSQSLVETLSGGTWTAAEVPRPAGAVASKNASLSSVSCPTADTCVATGWFNQTSNPDQPNPSFIATLSAGTWHTVNAPAPANASANQVYLNGVTCLTATSCVAVGSYDYNSPDKEGNGLLEVLSDGTWRPVRIGPPSAAATSNYFHALACPEVGVCVAAGAYHVPSGGTYQPLIETTMHPS